MTAVLDKPKPSQERRDGAAYAIHSSAEKSGHVTSKVLRGLKVRLSDLA